MDQYNIQKIKDNSPSWQEELLTGVLEENDLQHHIILHNDDVNTFEFVIETLIEICEHTPEQAEQCAFLVHFKGKCEVKSGSWEYLLPRNQKLVSRGLSSEII